MSTGWARRAPLRASVLWCIVWMWAPELPAQDAAPRPGVEPELAGGGHGSLPSGSGITEETRLRVWQRIEQNRRLLEAQGLRSPMPVGIQPLFSWPLRAAAGLTDNGYHAIDAFVDHAPAFPDVLTDYECGTRTYDTPGGYNHRGSDFFTWPFAWLKVDQSAVEVVAAAAGTIVDRGDGNFDRRCGCETDDPNYVIVEHADGSTVWYFHLKNGSVTAKPVGQSVQVGEYLGVVASSGCSGGPHLHFEVYDALARLVDPYDGNCNSLDPGNSWWAAQRPYFDSALNALSTHSALPEFPPCPQTELPHYRNNFSPGETAWFAVFYRDSLPGHQTELAVLRPDDSLLSSWTHVDPG
ncbi:MAG: M23 family metallopeptidase, partial [Holophagales bacterium]|nr:M23 family metallopeptidase [Holophagales bacterium]